MNILYNKSERSYMGRQEMNSGDEASSNLMERKLIPINQISKLI
jgi:hypothetical protein